MKDRILTVIVTLFVSVVTVGFFIFLAWAGTLPPVDEPTSLAPAKITVSSNVMAEPKPILTSDVPTNKFRIVKYRNGLYEVEAYRNHPRWEVIFGQQGRLTYQEATNLIRLCTTPDQEVVYP